MSQADWDLLNYIRAQMGLGNVVIHVLASMLIGTTEKGLNVAKQLCKANDCRLIIDN
ncbi:MAG: hypothetical protein ACTSU2_03730 [Promethearchaeota archaeon]